MPILILLLALPIVEIAVFILVGDWIGLWPTLLLVVADTVIGAVLLRRQGLSTLRRIREEALAGRTPARELVHGMMILVAGMLLLLPGLLTDVVGYLLFVPAIRDLGWRLLRGRLVVATSGTTYPTTRRSSVIELEDADFERKPPPGAPSSPWSNGRDGTLH